MRARRIRSIRNIRAAPLAVYRPIAGTGHWVHLDAPAEINAILDDFLAGVR